MTCPKCGNEQPDVFSQCQKCRFIFPSPQQSSPKAISSSPTPFAAIQSQSSVVSILGALAGVLVLGALLLWLWSPEGLPVPENSHINKKHAFAMTAPSGWVELSPDNYEEAFARLGDKLPKSLRDGLSTRRIEVGFVKLLDEPNFSPSINVVVMNTEVPELDEKQLAEGAQVLTGEYKKILDSFKLEKSELVTVDELTSAQFSSSGSLKLKTAEAKGAMQETAPGWNTYKEDVPAQWRTFNLKLSQTLVPGKKRAYIITCTSEGVQNQEYKRSFEDAIESFRVLERPSRFGPIVMGGVQGGLVTALAYLLYFIIASLIAIIRR